MHPLFPDAKAENGSVKYICVYIYILLGTLLNILIPE